MKLHEVYGRGSDDDDPSQEKHYGHFYNSLNDAQKYSDILSPGNQYEIWYTKKEYFRYFIGGYSALSKFDPELIPYSPKDLPKTHVKLGSISGNGAKNFDDIYMVMQGEAWSPQGEARNLIRGNGLGHTSMSVGDIIVTQSRMHLVDAHGFKELHPIGSLRPEK